MAIVFFILSKVGDIVGELLGLSEGAIEMVGLDETEGAVDAALEGEIDKDGD